MARATRPAHRAREVLVIYGSNIGAGALTTYQLTGRAR